MNGDDAGSGGKRGSGPAADDDLSARLRRLETQLDRTRDTAAASADGSGRPSSDPSGLGRAVRMSSEFVAGVIAGGGLGWLFDRGLGTSPWGLIVFLMLGFAAGAFNVIRAAGAPSGSKPKSL